MPSEHLRLEGVSAAWDGTPVLRQVSLSIERGEFVTLLGPNGSGKTTLLRVIAGLEPLTEGRIWMAGEEISRRPTHQRGIGLVAQEPALFPRRTVFDNIAYGLRLAGADRESVENEVARLLDLLHIEALASRLPTELSGGERQRVAIARAIAPKPSLLLLDEPFSALDPEIHAELRAEVKPLLRSLGITALHVTHDLEEGLFLGDRVALLREGRLLQSGAPRALFLAPASEGAARLLGYNIVRTPGGLVAAHPSEIGLVPPPSPLEGRVVASGPSGAESLVHVRLDGGELIELRLPPSVPAPAAEERVGLLLRRPVEIA